jgi:formylglycine-generating enzyme required for sulfatase activity
MGKHEVTQEQWESVIGKNPSDTKGAKLPVTNVSWDNCQDFITKLNVKTDGDYRLPTEAEWEYSCRAGTNTAFYFGDRITKVNANWGSQVPSSIKGVGNYKSNAFGLYDMHGNVWEWCEDWMADYPAGAVTDPKGPATGERRVLRVGSFDGNESKARSSYRGNSTAGRDFFTGLRLAKTP